MVESLVHRNVFMDVLSEKWFNPPTWSKPTLIIEKIVSKKIKLPGISDLQPMGVSWSDNIKVELLFEHIDDTTNVLEKLTQQQGSQTNL